MFKMSRNTFIHSSDGPLIIFHQNLAFPQIDHRLYTNHHSFSQLASGAPSSIIRNFRSLMQGASQTVSHHFTNYLVSTRFTVLLNGITDVSNSITLHSHFNAFIKSSFSGFKKSSNFGLHHSHLKSVGAVTKKSIQKHTAINRDNVSFLQGLFVGNPMNNLFVNRSTKGIGKTLIVEKPWNTFMVTNIGLGDFVQFQSADPGLYSPGKLSKSFTYQEITLPHQFNFFVSL